MAEGSALRHVFGSDLIFSIDSPDLAKEIDYQEWEAGLTKTVLLEAGIERRRRRSGFFV